MMTLFAFVLVLGIVVDDAIIIGESIHVQVESGLARFRGGLPRVRGAWPSR